MNRPPPLAGRAGRRQAADGLEHLRANDGLSSRVRRAAGEPARGVRGPLEIAVRGAFDEAVKYVKERTIFGRPIAASQGIRWKFADMLRDIEAGRGLLYRACLTANPFPDPHFAATAKVYCNEMSLRVTSEAIQVHGGYGFTDEYPVSRLYRGARYGSLGGGSSESLRDLVGRHIFEKADGPDGIFGLGTY